MKSQSAGFTLVEVVMACVIVAILAAIAIPTFNGWIANNQVTVQAEKLQGLLQYSRSYALSHHCDVIISPSRHDWSETLNVVAANKTIRQLPPIQGIECQWHGNFGKDDQLVFTASGATNGQQGSFILSKDNSHAKVVIFHSGRVRVSV